MDDSVTRSTQQNNHQPPRARPKRGFRWVFIGADGIRAGWSIAIFIATFGVVAFGIGRVLHYLLGPAPQHTTSLGLKFIAAFEGAQLLGVLAAVAVMARIERRSLLSFGLQGSARLARFVAGLVSGFAAVSVVVFALVSLHVLTLDTSPAADPQAWLHAIAWGGVFLLVGLCEELLLRGYLQYTLSRGIGFWWGALLLSALFSGFHGANPGETPVGLFSAAAIGLVFCLSLWYTGSLFWAIGFHAAWDWGESYFYGTFDSGTLVNERFMTAHPLGNALISGGSTGPEGSLLIFPMLAVMVLVMWLWWGRRVQPAFSGGAWRPIRR
ncbi:CPBP family intramembrane glutamic endopeptidase [Paraburkholderia sp. DHOC27]|uniref:CPBP family intramembrane glutamic endopeptidase n=1 Tax=Paraburkholderia sp. DHOC27 TaxID=2303330 RepID=UPI000E3CF737|nr:type II CAAX endopeptidase family protein [Paraburkholderia sp. DHOC27]RFU48500.1 CPBP family intramembrane metalloprotease [Paraburkholderia sp. DHOC27]